MNTNIDGFALPIGALDIGENIAIEYKNDFAFERKLNHPLILIDRIICWNYGVTPDVGAEIEDDFFHRGKVAPIALTSEQKSAIKSDTPIGFDIVDIRRKSQDVPVKGRVRVVSLRRLIQETFNIEWINIASDGPGIGEVRDAVIDTKSE